MNIQYKLIFHKQEILLKLPNVIESAQLQLILDFKNVTFLVSYVIFLVFSDNIDEWNTHNATNKDILFLPTIFLIMVLNHNTAFITWNDFCKTNLIINTYKNKISTKSLADFTLL